MIGNRKRIMEALAFGLAACGFGCFGAYGANEQFASAAGLGSGLRCIPALIKAATIAAVSGAPTLAKLTPMAYNTSTNKWNVWTYSAGEVTTLTKSGTVSGGTFTLTVNGDTTTAIAYNASNATVLAALVALGTVNAADVVLTGGAINSAALVATWGGQFTNQDITVSIDGALLTGGGSYVLTTVAGSANGADGSVGLAFVWPEAVVTSATDDTLANLLFAGEIHLDDIVVPSGETLANLKIVLQKYARKNNFNIQGLVQYR